MSHSLDAFAPCVCVCVRVCCVRVCVRTCMYIYALDSFASLLLMVSHPLDSSRLLIFCVSHALDSFDHVCMATGDDPCGGGRRAHRRRRRVRNAAQHARQLGQPAAALPPICLRRQSRTLPSGKIRSDELRVGRHALLRRSSTAAQCAIQTRRTVRDERQRLSRRRSRGSCRTQPRSHHSTAVAESNRVELSWAPPNRSTEGRCEDRDGTRRRARCPGSSVPRSAPFRTIR